MGYTNYDGGSAEYHALANLLYRNANFGAVSSDGRQLFVLEDPLVFSQRQPGQFWGWDPNPNQKQNAANQLTAYDLETGRVLWKAGGPSFGEAVELPLAGYFFFGPPVADGGELYLVGEKDDEVRLIALDPRSGKPRWSQLLGYSPAKIDQDVGRRWWSAPIAVGQGVLVCPTTVGWLVAVDRVTHDLLWGHRLDTGLPMGSRTEEEQQITAMVQQAPLAGRWAPAPPMIAGNRVVATPQESQHVLCLNLLDGKELWKQPRGEMLFVAGVFDDRVVLVGKKSITALSLHDDGKPIWTLECPTPAGRGIAVGQRYHLPLASGELWTINLADGTVTEKLFDPQQAGRLGNLAMYRGLLLSVSPLGVQAFEQREAIQAEIERRKQADPRDAWALLREAEIAALRRELPSALASLRQINAAGISADLRERFRTLLVECLVSQVRIDPAQHDRDFEELGKLMQTPAEKLRYQRLVADRQIARREFVAAFDTYLAMLVDPSVGQAFQPDGSRDVNRSQPGKADLRMNATTRSAGGVPSAWPLLPLRDDRDDIRVRLDLWVAGRLRDLWTKVPEANRNELNTRVQSLAEQTLARELASGGRQPPETIDSTAESARGADAPRSPIKSSEWDQFVTLFDFHAASLPVKWKRIERLAGLRDLIATEQSLTELRRHADPAVAAEATARLVRLMLDLKLVDQAEQLCNDLLLLPGSTRLADGTTATAFVEDLRKSGAIAAESSRPARLDWSREELSVSRMGANYSNSLTQDVPAVASRLPFFRDHRLQVPHEDQRLEVVDAATERLDWSIPLRSRANAQDNGLVTAEAMGHAVVLLHRGVLHGVSPVEKSIRWSFPLDGHAGGGQVYYNYQFNASVPPMQSSLRFSNTLAQKQQMSQSGSPLSHVTGRYICCQGRRGLTVYDSVTGQVMWTHDGLRPGTQICGDDDVLYVRTADQQKSLALRSIDGQSIEMPKLHEWLNSAVHVIGRCFVFADGAGPKSKPALRLFDPLTNKDVWNGVELPSGTLMALQCGLKLALLDSKAGNFRRVDLRSGREVQLGTVASDDLNIKNRQEVFALADYDRVYLVINGPRQAGAFYSDGLSSIRVSGKIVAFDPRAGKQVWSQAVSSQNLLLERFDHVPLLVFAARNHTKIGNHHLWTLNLVALDKQTGAKLLDANAPAQNGFRSLIVNMSDRFVELRGYGERVRLQATKSVVSNP
jgi:outer membrane protein assembly factor BamB